MVEAFTIFEEQVSQSTPAQKSRHTPANPPSAPPATSHSREAVSSDQITRPLQSLDKNSPTGKTSIPSYLAATGPRKTPKALISRGANSFFNVFRPRLYWLLQVEAAFTSTAAYPQSVSTTKSTSTSSCVLQKFILHPG